MTFGGPVTSGSLKIKSDLYEMKQKQLQIKVIKFNELDKFFLHLLPLASTLGSFLGDRLKKFIPWKFLVQMI